MPYTRVSIRRLIAIHTATHPAALLDDASAGAIDRGGRHGSDKADLLEALRAEADAEDEVPDDA